MSSELENPLPIILTLSLSPPGTYNTLVPRERTVAHAQVQTTTSAGASPSSLAQNSPEDDREKLIKDMLRVSKFSQDSDPFGVTDLVTVEDLFKARVHFGHKSGMWNHRMRPYLYGVRNGLHIFNLNTTLVCLRRALNVVGHMAYQYGVILFVNERPQFEALTQQMARSCGEYFVTEWVPGTLTNSYKLLRTLKVPDLVVFLSVPRSKSAVKEAVTYGLPSVGVVDSDCDPNFILYPIPGNDDTPHAVKLYSDLFAEVVLRAKETRARDEREAKELLQMEAEKRKVAKAEEAAALDAELDSIYQQQEEL